MEQVAQGGCGFPIPDRVQDQVGYRPLSSTVEWEVFLTWQVGWDDMIFKVPYNPLAFYASVSQWETLSFSGTALGGPQH